MSDQNSFFDKKNMYVLVVVFGVLFAWNMYLAKKYPQKQGDSQASVANLNGQEVAEEKDASPEQNKSSSFVGGTQINSQQEDLPSSQSEAKDEVVHFENDDVKFIISSFGMGIKEFTLKRHTDREGNFIQLGRTQFGLFPFSVIGDREPVNFRISKISEFEFEGFSEVKGTKIKRIIKFNTNNSSFENKVQIENMTSQIQGFSVLNSEKSIGHVETSMIKPVFDSQEFVIEAGGKTERIKSSSLKNKTETDFSSAMLVGLSSHYFTSVLLDKSEIFPKVSVVAGTSNKEDVSAEVKYFPNQNGANQFNLNWTAYVGGKSISALEQVGGEFKKVLDLGMFSSLGFLQMHAMKWFHSIIPNWGVSIILLTLLVRLLVLPLNVSTFKATKKMQEVQPKIAALREKFKDDPQSLNRETMNLWKENKINPFGGCLPMLLQLPVFLALYQVLGQSIELYKAPFLGWIQDLSQHDPYYVLPALLAVAMYFQQKLTPTAVDPAQAKMMQFLPLIFAAMMINLPAGLNLYIFINTLSGVLLQQVFMRDRKNSISKA